MFFFATQILCLSETLQKETFEYEFLIFIAYLFLSTLLNLLLLHFDTRPMTISLCFSHHFIILRRY